ncbi:MAG: NAD(P)/FAD-dependent oxidoreductase [Betaproteobacteria bacterium]|nr:NAD(P)/FAD-dependent oxidoreductase [Betaproteobacteria bacterium]
MQKMKLVVVGNGMAGMRTVEELLKLAPALYDITVFGAEPHPNYNRILLSPVLAGEQTIDDIVLNTRAWYDENGIRLRTGQAIVKIDRRAREVIAADGTRESYDRLLLATGSNPFILPLPGKDLQGVLTYRDIADTQAMIAAAATHKQAVVIGGGLLGLEAANGLKLRGMEVTVVHVMPWLMERQLDRTAAGLLQKSLEDKGLAFRLEAHSEALLGDDAGRAGHVRAVKLKSGEEIPAQLVVMAVGIRPNTALAESAGLHCNRGLVVNDTMQTYDPRIYAVGECVSHRGIAYGLVAPLFEQAKVCANHLAQFGIGRYTGSQISTKLKVTGVDLFSAGNFAGGTGCEDIVLSDPGAGVYKKLVLKDDKLIGAVMIGDTIDGAWYFKLIRDGSSVGALRDRLMFGEANLGDTGHQGQNRAAAMADSAEVCGCNGVCKGTIVKTIQDQGLFTLDEVRKHTKASSSCGSCTGLVEQILMATAGGDYSEAPKKKSMCGCTDRTHQEVRDAIRAQHLTSIPAVQAFLEWRTPNGCATCRPALNYYLLSTWPKEAIDDPQSRFINERSHANIQKDGTYSVVPRMWGGETNSGELRRIAHVVDKFKIPTVKVTGGQRLDLLGVKKEDLPAVWKELDMPSGHAYAKALRTVKTCVGSEWCRFGTQDSTRMGQELERALWRMYAPHKVKLAVSGCPRNCAESGIKDVGVIGVDSGWEIYVAGNGGIKTEVAQFFAKVKTHTEVLEYSGAFLQLYREEGWYLERTVHYVNRVGLDHCKARVVDDAANRKALWERLQFALDGEPDPWHEPDKARVDLKQFALVGA